MVFSAGIKKIYESIDKQENKETLLEELSSKIIKDPVNFYRFSLYEKIFSNLSKLNITEAKAFMSNLQTEHEVFGMHHQMNSKSLFVNKEKELFEYFNINYKNLIPTKIDLILDQNNNLNEGMILELISKKGLEYADLKESVNKKKTFLKEYYKGIVFNNNVEDFKREIKSIRRLSRVVKEASLPMINESIKSILKEYKKDKKTFKNAIDKTFKLRILVERLIKEFIEDASIPTGKIIKMPDLTFIKKIEIEVPRNESTEAVVFNFNVPIYPESTHLTDAVVEMKKVKRDLLKLERVFINQFIYQKNVTLLDPVGTNWNVMVRTEGLNPGKPVNAKFEIIMFVNEGSHVEMEEYAEVAYSILKGFDEYLPTVYTITDKLTPDSMKTNMKTAAKGRKTTYATRDGEDKYYEDKLEDDFAGAY